jgi:hypothetical protein
MNKKRRRLNLYQRDPHCHWCRCLTVLPPEGSPPKVTPPNEATIDHLRDRYDPRRREPARNQEERTVLACRGCNARRNTERQAEMAELHAASSARGHFKKQPVHVADNPLAAQATGP